MAHEMSDVNHMTVKQFREDGYLHEINRQLLHPLGLALEVAVDNDGTESISGVWDYRADPEGIVYGADLLSPEKAMAVKARWDEREAARMERLGYMVQPLDRPLTDESA